MKNYIFLSFFYFITLHSSSSLLSYHRSAIIFTTYAYVHSHIYENISFEVIGQSIFKLPGRKCSYFWEEKTKLFILQTIYLIIAEKIS